jgi:RNA polymerase sigma-70 factor (ECF subfamily)
LKKNVAKINLDPSIRLEVIIKVKPAGQIERESFSKDPSKALEEMMKQYGSTVLRTAFYYMNDRHIAEDVSQEVFIRAYRNWSSFRGDSSVITWLTKITVNVCRDKAGLKMYTEQPTDPGTMVKIHPGSVEDEVLKRLSNTLILKHILQLPQHYQEVLYFYYYLDFNTKEIAEATSTAEGTVRGRLHRARQLLEDYLRKEGLDNE